jgi:hypothetical protein
MKPVKIELLSYCDTVKSKLLPIITITNCNKFLENPLPFYEVVFDSLLVNVYRQIRKKTISLSQYSYSIFNFRNGGNNISLFELS